MRRGAVFSAAALILLLCASCGSSSAKVFPNPTTTTTTRAPSAAREALEFRKVLGEIPYKGAAGTCQNGKAVTRDIPTAQVVLPDLANSACYLLDPVLLTGRDIESARAIVEEATSSWVVELRFGNDDFVTKVASTHVGDMIAIVFRGVVQSAPRINSGITGRDVTISSNFTQKSATLLARELSS